MVLPFVQFIDSFAALKVIAAEEAGLLKLCQNAVHGGQANVGIVLQKVLENILGRHVPLSPLLKDFKYLLSRDGGLESSAFEFVHENWFANERQGLGEFDSPEPNATATMT
jgi:hypothetical protein